MISPEDILRLNSLISLCDAIRIDEYKMCVLGLDNNRKERKMILNPSIDHHQYLVQIRQFLTNTILGTMGGYPAYLKRWSRMGNVSLKNLTQLLKLGSVEAVIAVVNTKDLPADILPLVWWCAVNTDEQAEIGRFLLTKPEVLNHPIKTPIANYLLEFLPFLSADVNALMNTVYLLLTDGLIKHSYIERLWQQGSRKPVFLVPFLEKKADNLPMVGIKPLIMQDKNIAYLEKINTDQGQLFLQTSLTILKKVNHEYVLYRTLEALGQYCHHHNMTPSSTIAALKKQAEQVLHSLKILEHTDKVYARLLLGGVSEKLVVSDIAKHALTGSAIRKKLKSTLQPILDALTILTK